MDLYRIFVVCVVLAGWNVWVDERDFFLAFSMSVVVIIELVLVMGTAISIVFGYPFLSLLCGWTLWMQPDYFLRNQWLL